MAVPADGAVIIRKSQTSDERENPFADQNDGKNSSEQKERTKTKCKDIMGNPSTSSSLSAEFAHLLTRHLRFRPTSNQPNQRANMARILIAAAPFSCRGTLDMGCGALRV